MTEWSAGYITDVGYTYGFYPELNPLRMKLPFINAGLAFPDVETACDLGFGQGISINVFGAASAVNWYGTDFSPTQVAFARRLAEASGTSIQLNDQTFAEYAANTDLPDFDFIGIHGIWSWISEENRAVLVDFVRRKLKVGGVVYISYNTYPGWSSMMPLQHLMSQHSVRMGAEGQGVLGRMSSAIGFVEKLLDLNSNYSRANPALIDWAKRLKTQNQHYVAHEYLNRNWQSMYFAEFARCMEPTKLTFACSSHYLDHVDVLNLTPPQQAFLQGIPDPVLRETARDLISNQGFRRDYWVKGGQRLSVSEQQAAARQIRVVLVKHRDEVTLTLKAAVGEVNLAVGIYEPILDCLAGWKPLSIGQIEQAIADKKIPFAQLLQAITVLVGVGFAAPAQEDEEIRRAKKHTDRLNAHLMTMAQGDTDVHYLASPVTGSAIGMARFQQLFLLCYTQGRRTAIDMAQYVGQILAQQSQFILKDGQPLRGEEETMVELTAQATQFLTRVHPLIKALAIG